ncbi:MAG: hypothetical protein ACI4OL_03320 [Gemmiger sp.]
MAAVLLWILKALGVVLLVLLALLVILLLLPVGVALRWQGGELHVQAKVLAFRFTIYPQKPKEKQAAPAVTPPPGGEASPKRDGFKEKLIRWAKTDTLEKAQHLLEDVSPAVRMILRGLRIRHVIVVWPVTGQDAADTAVRYGALMSACNNLWERATEVLNIRADELRLEPDFVGNLSGTAQIACQITTQLYIMVIAGIYLLFRVLRDPALHL